MIAKNWRCFLWFDLDHYVSRLDRCGFTALLVLIDLWLGTLWSALALARSSVLGWKVWSRCCHLSDIHNCCWLIHEAMICIAEDENRLGYGPPNQTILLQILLKPALLWCFSYRTDHEVVVGLAEWWGERFLWLASERWTQKGTRLLVWGWLWVQVLVALPDLATTLLK